MSSLGPESVVVNEKKEQAKRMPISENISPCKLTQKGPTSLAIILSSLWPTGTFQGMPMVWALELHLEWTRLDINDSALATPFPMESKEQAFVTQHSYQPILCFRTVTLTPKPVTLVRSGSTYREYRDPPAKLLDKNFIVKPWLNLPPCILITK